MIDRSPPDSCPCCQSSALETIYQLRDIPTTSNLLMLSREEATNWPRGNLTLRLCWSCGFIHNSEFDPQTQAHSARYEATQGHSPTFGGFARALAQKWTDRHHLRGKRLLEIGCLQGEFITQLCEIAETSGIGIDPALDPARTPPQASGRVEFIQDFYGPKYAHLPADFICCRHTLEHIARPYEFLKTIRDAVGDRSSVLCLEVPDTQRVLEEGAFWDIYYEHCSYFTSQSLRNVFERAGFKVVEQAIEYDGQYLVVDAVPAQPGETDAPPAERLDASRLFSTRQRWQDFFARQGAARIALWGSGSKAVGFLTSLGLSHESLPFVVDINPNKQGTFLPGTGQQIISPARLASYSPDVVIAMNPIYREEIRNDLNELNVQAELITL